MKSTPRIALDQSACSLQMYTCIFISDSNWLDVELPFHVPLALTLLWRWIVADLG